MEHKVDEYVAKNAVMPVDHRWGRPDHPKRIVLIHSGNQFQPGALGEIDLWVSRNDRTSPRSSCAQLSSDRGLSFCFRTDRRRGQFMRSEPVDMAYCVQ